MRCAEVQELFSEIYDGVAKCQADLAKHLQDCPICAAEYERYSRLMDEVRQLPEPELPPGFHEAIMGKIREIAPANNHAIKQNRRPAKRAVSVSRRWAGVAAAACVLLISLWAVRVFDLPAARSNDEVAYSMADAQAEAAAGGDFVAATAEEEDFEGLFAEDDSLNIGPRMALPEAYDDDLGFEAAGSSIPFDASIDAEDEAEAVPWVAIAGELSEEEQSLYEDFVEFAPDTEYSMPEYSLGRNHQDAPNAMHIEHTSIDMFGTASDEINLPATDGRANTWAWAASGGLAILCITSAAVYWVMYKKRAKKG